jgi:hypothetical protein
LQASLGHLPERKKFQLHFTAIYSSGLQINSSKQAPFSTFSVQNGTLSSVNRTSGLVCFTCNFVNGTSPADGCLVIYQSLNISTINGTLIINQSADSTKCIENIYAGIYLVKFYDVYNDNYTYLIEPAYELIHELEKTSIETSISLTTTSFLTADSISTIQSTLFEHLTSATLPLMLTTYISPAASSLSADYSGSGLITSSEYKPTCIPYNCMYPSSFELINIHILQWKNYIHP